MELSQEMCVSGWNVNRSQKFQISIFWGSFRFSIDINGLCLGQLAKVYYAFNFLELCTALEFVSSRYKHLEQPLLNLSLQSEVNFSHPPPSPHCCSASCLSFTLLLLWYFLTCRKIPKILQEWEVVHDLWFVQHWGDGIDLWYANSVIFGP